MLAKVDVRKIATVIEDDYVIVEEPEHVADELADLSMISLHS